MEPQIGIKSANITKVAGALNTLLADEFVLYLQTRKAHWNVESGDFYFLHKFFEDQYTQVNQISDDIAERIRTLGHYAAATLKEYLALTHLSEDTGQANDGKGHLKGLLNTHESIIINIRKHAVQFADVYHDAGTSDFITGIMESHEKMAWMIRAHLK